MLYIHQKILTQLWIESVSLDNKLKFFLMLYKFQ